jgi:hypothetical protein
MTHLTSIRRFILALFVGVLLAMSALASSKGSHHRSPKDGRAKTQHVSGYTTKSGKHVRPYNRRPPK